MRKSEKTAFQWPKVSRLLTMLPRHRPDFRTGPIFSFQAPEVPVLKVRKSHFHCNLVVEIAIYKFDLFHTALMVTPEKFWD